MRCKKWQQNANPKPGNAVSESENIVVETAEKIFADLADAQDVNRDKTGAWKTPLWQALSEAGLPLSWVAEEFGGSGASLAEGDGADSGVDHEAEDEEAEETLSSGSGEDGIDFRFVDAEDDFLEAFRGGKSRARAAEHNALDREKLEGVLRDLIACRQMLDRVMKEG